MDGEVKKRLMLCSVTDTNTTAIMVFLLSWISLSTSSAEPFKPSQRMISASLTTSVGSFSSSSCSLFSLSVWASTCFMMRLAMTRLMTLGGRFTAG
nr:MAG: 100 kDa protein [unidentified adenovirus]